MDINAAFPSKYLKAADVGTRRVPVTISTCTTEEMSDGDHKPVLYFGGKEKGLVLNKTNAMTLADAYGGDTDQWTGKPAILFTIDTEYGGRRIKGLRIDPGVEPAPVPEPDIDEDDLPF